ERWRSGRPTTRTCIRPRSRPCGRSWSARPPSETTRSADVETCVELVATGDAQLLVDGSQVVLDRADRDVELLGDRAVGHPASQGGDLTLPSGEPTTHQRLEQRGACAGTEAEQVSG